ncbi:MAG: carboxypeptidase regulatory-like domain-containing protein [Pyrinomonadaceae bacterium]
MNQLTPPRLVLLATRFVVVAALLLILGSVESLRAQTVLNLTDFGAVGDGVTDDGPALQAALDALAAGGGGTLFVPQGRYAILTTVVKDFSGLATSIEIAGVPSSTVVDTTGSGQELSTGLNLVSEFYPRTGVGGIAIQVAGLHSFLIHDVAFVGTPEVATDAIVTLDILRVDDATIRHCEFYGLLNEAFGGAIVRAIQSGLAIQQTKFLGSSGNSGVYAPIVENLQWKRIAVSDTVFLDYGQRPELYGKTGYGAPISWINAGNAAAVTSDSPRREIVLDRVFMDEGQLFGLSVMPYRYSPPSAPIDLLYMNRLRMNVSNLGGNMGNLVYYPKAVLIESSRYQWSHNTFAAISLYGVNRAIIARAECVDSAHTIRADSATGSLTVIDSIYQNLFSDAQVTSVINTQSPEEDPVQYVREQFTSIPGRAPDAAAHYYWSDLLLQCGEDANCVTNRRELLQQYLDSSPNPNFKLEGRVMSDVNAPVAGALVTLSGSQSVTALTDAQGHYSFSNLPTSGNYTVSAAKTQYNFGNSTIAINTPAGDQTVDFVGVVDRYTISGRIADASGQGLADATVSLTGVLNAEAQTDANGNYSFSGVPADADYNIIPSKFAYVFDPGTGTIDDLSADATANFTLITHNISGRVTKPNGNPIVSAVLTVSGGTSKSTTTDANGNYTLAYVPAGDEYVLSISRVNYTFAPPTNYLGTLDEDRTANFTGTPVTLTISGRVTTDYLPLSGVTMTMIGTETGSAVTHANGTFSFNVAAEGTYKITPSRTHYSFDPVSFTTYLTANETSDFTATLNRHTISGRVTGAGNTGVSGVTMALSGFTSAITTTNANGDYSFDNLAAGQTHTVTPAAKYYSFTQPSETFSELGSNVSAGFVATLRHHSISGRTTNADGSGLAGVTITLSGQQSGSAMSDANGNYAFSNLPAGPNYRVIASKTDYLFAPAGEVLIDLDGDRQVNFTSFPSYQVTTQVQSKGLGLPGVTITITGGQSVSGTTDDEGDHTFNLAAQQTYTITPSRVNYTFTPPSISFDNLSSSKLAEFTAVLNVGVPVLISHPDSTRALAFDSVLGTIEPFALNYDYAPSPDRRTRVMLFATNFDLAPGETPTSITADAQDASGRVYSLTVEYFAKVEGQNWLSCMVIRLNDELGDVGDVLFRITYRGIASNRVRVGIGHVGGGPADDTTAIPTPGSGP